MQEDQRLELAPPALEYVVSVSYLFITHYRYLGTYFSKALILYCFTLSEHFQRQYNLFLTFHYDHASCATYDHSTCAHL